MEQAKRETRAVLFQSSICLVHARKHARKHRSLSLIAAASKYPLPVKSVTPSTSNQLAVALSPNRDMAEEDRNTVYQIKPKSTRDAQGTPNCITRQPAAAIHGGDRSLMSQATGHSGGSLAMHPTNVSALAAGWRPVDQQKSICGTV